MSLAYRVLGSFIIDQGMKFISKDPETNLDRLIDWADRIARLPHHKKSISSIKRAIGDPSSPWRAYAIRLLKQVHPKVRERLAVNFFVNAGLLGVPKQHEMAARLGCSVPFTILMDPTERCNLRCRGCWAGDYPRNGELDFQTMDRVIREGEELGIYFIVLSGGEPLMRKDDILALADKYPHHCFHVFTNGTLIDDKFVEDLLRVANVTFAISIEGFESTTDERRGKGVFRKVMNAMDLLKEAGLVYGFSATYTRKNTEELGSDEFVDLMIDKGCALGWFFTYVPVGKDVDLEYMATPDQRAYMFRRMSHFRATKPLFMVDFWNDGEASQGCIAGGRRYLHINALGDVEPCAFVHFATCNIKDVTLKEALRSPLMLAYQKRQPFNENMLRPCPLIDNPHALGEIVKESGAKTTQLSDLDDIDEFVAKMSQYSQAWGEAADAIWRERACACGAATGVGGGCADSPGDGEGTRLTAAGK